MSAAAPINTILQALVERLIPADSDPSGWQAGAGAFLARILTTDLQGSAPLVAAGLDLLQQEAHARHAGADFADLAPTAQDALITALLAGQTTVDWAAVPPDQFMALLIRLAAQGFYGDPDNGGN